MYTSGTTGDPKGVMISNESIVTLIAGVIRLLKSANEAVSFLLAFMQLLWFIKTLKSSSFPCHLALIIIDFHLAVQINSWLWKMFTFLTFLWPTSLTELSRSVLSNMVLQLASRVGSVQLKAYYVNQFWKFYVNLLWVISTGCQAVDRRPWRA